MYLEPIQTSKMELFLKIVNSLTPLTILTKSSILDVWPGSENATKSSNKSFCVFNIFSFSSRLNTFFPFTLKIFRSSSIWKRFSTSNIQKRFSSFVVQDFYFYSNKYLRKNTSMQISLCRQDKTMVSDNYKGNLHHFHMKKVEHVQLFHIKMKED